MKRLLFVLLFFPLIGNAEQITACPQQLDMKSTAQVSSEWEVVESSVPNTLERIGFFSGHPADHASLVPDESKSGKGEAKEVWIFSPEEQEKIWLACFYTGTAMSIAKPLEKGLRQCQVSYKTTPTGSRLSVVGVRCW